MLATFETPRLTLAPLAPSDAEDLHHSFADPETMRFWHTPRHGDLAATRAEVESMLAVPGAAWWAIRRRGDPGAIGFAGFRTVLPPAGLGYFLARSHWRQGIAAEAAGAALEHGFTALGLDRVELWAHAGNRASRRLAERLGFEPRSAFWQTWPVGGPAETIVYGRDREPAARPPAWIDGLEPVLSVQDVGRSIEFYRDRLGFRLEFAAGDPPVHAVLSCGEWSFRGGRVQFTAAPAVSPATLYLRAAGDLDALCATLRERGVEIVEAPETKPWRMREFTARDPNGALLRFGTPA